MEVVKIRDILMGKKDLMKKCARCALKQGQYAMFGINMRIPETMLLRISGSGLKLKV